MQTVVWGISYSTSNVLSYKQVKIFLFALLAFGSERTYGFENDDGNEERTGAYRAAFAHQKEQCKLCISHFK